MTMTMTYAMNNSLRRWFMSDRPYITLVGLQRHWLELQSPSLSYHLDLPFPIDIASLFIAVPRSLIDICA